MITEFTLKVQIGVTPELATILGAMLQGRTAAVAQLPETSDQPEDKPAKPKRQRTAPAAVDEPTPAADPQPTVEEAAPEQAQPAQPEAPTTDAPKQYTEEDIRAAMHKTRQRIEGGDYKTNTDGDLYKRYHKQLTASFKNIASMLGAEKPSALPADKRESFCIQCEELYIDDNGELQVKLPF
jgi:outer membrane biosynthesis protein TonB